MCDLELYRNGTARLNTFITGIARRVKLRAMLSAVVPWGTAGIRGIPDGYFPGIPNGYRWVFQGIDGYFAKSGLRLAQISQCKIGIGTPTSPTRTSCTLDMDCLDATADDGLRRSASKIPT